MKMAKALWLEFKCWILRHKPEPYYAEGFKLMLCHKCKLVHDISRIK